MSIKDFFQRTNPWDVIAPKTNNNDDTEDRRNTKLEETLLETLSEMTPPHVTWVRDTTEDEYPYSTQEPRRKYETLQELLDTINDDTYHAMFAVKLQDSIVDEILSDYPEYAGDLMQEVDNSED